MVDLPAMPSDVSAKWRNMIDRRVAMTDRVVAQNLFSGEIQLIPKSAVGVATRKVHVKKAYAGIEYDAPARNRVVSGDEGKELWRLSVTHDYFKSAFMKDQAQYSEAAGASREHKRRIGDVDVSHADLIDDRGIREAALEIARLNSLADNFAQHARLNKEAWLALAAHLKELAETARKSIETAERDAVDRSAAEDEIRRERAKQAVRAKSKQTVEA